MRPSTRATWRQDQGTEIQTLILSKDLFPTRAEAETWVREHGFLTRFQDKGVDKTEESWRFRQRDVGAFREGSLRTIDLPGTKGVKAVIGVPA